MSETINKGDFFLYHQSNGVNPFGNSGIMQQSIGDKVPFVAVTVEPKTSISKGRIVAKSLYECYTDGKFDIKKSETVRTYSMTDNCCTKITEGESIKFTLEFIAKKHAAFNNFKEEIAKKVIPEAVPVLKRPYFLTSNKTAFSSNFNFLQLGKINKVSNKDLVKSQLLMHTNQQCCAITKTTADIKIYMPKLWVDYHGYTEADIIRYIKILTETPELNFSAKYLGVHTYDTMMDFSLRSINVNNPIPKNIVNFYFPGNEAYLILLKGNDKNIHTYLNFIALRYLYNFQYCNIPMYVLKIHKALKGKVTNFQILLLAHLCENYYGYYCWANPREQGRLLVFQDPKVVMKLVRDGSTSLNRCFNHAGISYDGHTRFTKFFQEENWEGLLEEVKKLENVK